MRALAARIRRETAQIGHCAIYEKDLERLWAVTEANRETKIAEFAKKYGFKLSFYKQGLCAIFERDYIAQP